MSRWAPAITNLYQTTDGVRIDWTLDTFFSNPESPEKVRVDTHDGTSKVLDGDARTHTIPTSVIDRARQKGLRLIGGNVVFVWSNEQLSSGFWFPVVTSTEATQHRTQPNRVPKLTLTARHSKTLHQSNRITLAWSGHNFNHGELIWGPEGNTSAHRSKLTPRRIPGDVIYSGTFTTSGLAPDTAYQFRAITKNTHERWETSRTIVVRSLSNHRSVREFLHASGVPLSGPPGTVRLSQHLGAGVGLRSLLGI
jgi:hypothetical protein